MVGHARLPLRFLGACCAAGLAVAAASAQRATPKALARPAAQPPRPAARLTIDQLVDIKHPSNPVWSRDSRSIAFTWERTGLADLYVVPADGSAAPRALTTDGGGVTGVFWSPDSRTVYFSRMGNLIEVPADGSQVPRAVWPKPPGRNVVVAKDGARVAYLAGGGGPGGRGAPGTQRDAQAEVGPSPTEARVRSLVDGSDRVVATVDGPIASLAWTGDGEALTYSTGTGPQTIRHDQAPVYSGARIIYTTTEVVPAPPAPSFVVPVTGGVPRSYNSGQGSGFGGRGAAANRWIDAAHFLTDRTVEFKRREIYVGDTLGGEPKLLHTDVKDTFWSMTGGAQGGPQASPNGKWISFLSDRDGWDHLYVMPASGGEPIQVTKGRFEAWRPTWSPEGTRIAFDSNEGPNPGSRHIGIAEIGSDARTAKLRMVTAGRGADIQPSWSPDGARLVYQHTDPRNSADLWVVDATVAAAKPVASPTRCHPASTGRRLSNLNSSSTRVLTGRACPRTSSCRAALIARRSTPPSSGFTATA